MPYAVELKGLESKLHKSLLANNSKDNSKPNNKKDFD